MCHTMRTVYDWVRVHVYVQMYVCMLVRVDVFRKGLVVLVGHQLRALS
jgi:hypothetical protein